MCGNGGRCLVKFAYHRGIVRSSYHFMAVDGEHTAEIDGDGTVSLQMQNVDLVNYHNSYALINTGSPHFVKFANNVEDIDVVETGREIRYSKEFKEQGINVNFVESVDEDGIFVRTYERGVEDETMSCGTGVTASAIALSEQLALSDGDYTIGIQTPGGNLVVKFHKDAGTYTDVWLCGPATAVFKGNIELNN